MSTTLITSRRQREITTSTSSRRTPATSTSSQRASTTSTTQRKPSATPTSLRVASSSPTALPTNLASDFSFIQLETNPVPSATNSIDQPSLIDTSVGASETCSTDTNCTKDQTCSSSRCVAMNGAAPLGGSGPEPTSQLTPGSAIGIGVGVVGLVVLMVALGYWFWRIRARRPRPQTIEEPSNDLRRCATNATDQRTLVASLPNSPRTQPSVNNKPWPRSFSPELLRLTTQRRKRAARDRIHWIRSRGSQRRKHCHLARHLIR